MKHKLNVITIVALALVWLVLPQAQGLAAEYYLDALNGNDSFAGTPAQPWRTISKALNTVSSGDTVIMAGGTYEPVKLWNWARFTNWVTLKAAPGEKPIIPYFDFTGSFGRDLYLRFEGLTVQPGKTAPYPTGPPGLEFYIYLQNANHVQIVNNTFIGLGYKEEGKDVGVSLPDTDNVLIENNYFTGIGTGESVGGVPTDEAKGSWYAISVRGKNITIRNNEIEYHGTGIGFHGMGNVLIENNHIHHGQDNGMMGRGFGVQIINNHIHHIIQPTGWRTHNDGIQIKHDPGANDWVIRGNIIHHTDQGMFLNPQDGSNWLIENNLVYDTPTPGSNAVAVTIGQVNGLIFRNNIVNGSVTIRKNYPSIYPNTVVTSFHNNIVQGITFYEDGDNNGDVIIEKEDYNIYVSYASWFMSSHVWGAHTQQLSIGQFEALFANYVARDFRPASNSLAIDFCPLSNHPTFPSPQTDREGAGRVDIIGVGNDGTDYADAGCYEYIPTYYVSPMGGAITPHDGLTEDRAFTLAEAQNYANANPNTEITFLLASGNYGDFIDSSIRTAYLDFRAQPAQTPVFRRMVIGNGSGQDANLRFYGIKVDADTSLGQNTPMVLINYANNVEFYDCEWYGHERYDGVAPEIYGNNFRMEDCEVHYGTSYGPSPLDPGSKSRGINIFAGTNFLIKDCHIHDMSSSAIYVAAGTSGTIDGCHIHDQRPAWPGFDGTAEPKHGSGIALFGSDVTIQNNIIHACGASGGQIFVYSEVNNVTIQNNLLYDGKGFSMQGDAYFGQNCKFNNNIIVTNWQSATPSTSPQRYAKGVTFQFPGYDGSFEFYNNIIIAYMETDGTDISGESNNNIVYSFKPTLGWTGSPLWVNTGLGPNSVILNSQIPGYGWMWKDTLEGGGWDPESDFFVGSFDLSPWINTSYLTWNSQAGNYEIKAGSAAIGFADGLVSAGGHAPLTDILGNLRDIDPDAGCYEYVASIPGDVNADAEISAFDAALAAHIAVDLEHPDIKNRAAAEVSGDGEVTAYDAALIAQKAVGLIEKFPVEG